MCSRASQAPARDTIPSYHVGATAYHLFVTRQRVNYQMLITRLSCRRFYNEVFYRITTGIWFLVKYNLIGAAISEAHGVLGLVHERGLRQGSVRAEAKR